MCLLKWYDRQYRLEKRKLILGEKITSDLSWRKFSTKKLIKLNTNIDFDDVEYIYDVGSCNGKEKYIAKVKNLIIENKLSKIPRLNGTIEEGQDIMGTIPIGGYITTYVWKMKNGSSFAQVIKGSFSSIDEKIEFQQKIENFDIKKIDSRKLIYPIT